MSEIPLRGVYEFVHPGDDIEVYYGDGALNEVPVAPVRIWMPMRRGLSIRWQTSSSHLSPSLDSSTLSIDHPQLGSVDLLVDVGHSDGWGTLPGQELGADKGLDRVIAHWVNLPLMLPTSSLISGKVSWLGRWHLESCDWAFTLDSRPDLSDVLRLADELDEQFVLTHVSELRRVDSEEFDAKSAARILFAWQLAMSFALGRWVAPALPVGFDREGERIWEQWAPWRCDTIRGYQSWWDTHTADDLADFVGAFIEAYLDPHEHPIVRHVAMHMITANHSGTTAEGKVMLAQAGLEYLAWVTLVLTGPMSKKAFRALGTAERLRPLLDEAQIPLDVPSELDGLFELANRRDLDGPDAIVWVRNRLAHPKDAGEPYRIDGLVWQTSQLLLEYGELLLLHRVGYTGRFMRRYPPMRSAHASEPVPWAGGV